MMDNKQSPFIFLSGGYLGCFVPRNWHSRWWGPRAWIHRGCGQGRAGPVNTASRSGSLGGGREGLWFWQFENVTGAERRAPSRGPRGHFRRGQRTRLWFQIRSFESTHTRTHSVPSVAADLQQAAVLSGDDAVDRQLFLAVS